MTDTVTEPGALTEREFQAVQRLNAEYREAHFRARLRAGAAVVILEDARGPYLIAERAGADGQRPATVLPVWCDPRYAAAYAAAVGLADMRPRAITKDAWESAWRPWLRVHAVSLGVMPQDGERDFCVTDA